MTQDVPMPSNSVDQTPKQYLFQQFLTKYQDLSKFINQLPINEKLKEVIVKEFDTGFLWGKEAFATLVLPKLEEPTEMIQPYGVDVEHRARKKSSKKAKKKKNGKRKSA